MKPLRSNLHLKPEDGCSKISSSCVIWQGPDIPCIELCKGDSITDVIYDLAMLLCDMTEGVVDISGLDFKCLIEEGIAEPTTLIATLQAIIDKQCFFEENCCSDSSGGSVIVPISLPPCLYYTEDGDEITSLLPAAYSQYLATEICKVITEIASIKLSITNLQNRVTVLENNTGGGGSGTTISIVSQCASSPSPGAVVPIGQAFSAFEGKFCQLTSLIGTNAALSTAISKECTDLDIAPQLSNAEQTMSDLPGWVATPTTLSQTITNMWLTICDMRTAIEACCSGTTPAGCVPVPVSNIQLTNLSSSGSTINWTAPSVGTNENPIQYNIQAFEWNGSATVGSAILNTTVPFGTNSYNVTLVPDATKDYQIQIIAEYSCENSSVATLVAKLALTAVTYCVEVTDVSYDDIIQNCNGNTFTNRRRKTTLTLKDSSTNATVGNAYAPFNVLINYEIDGDCSPGSGPTEIITKTFGTGISVIEHIYFSEEYVQCFPTDPCSPLTKIYNCIQEITGDRAVACPGEVTCLT
jgi:hypothetical protein